MGATALLVLLWAGIGLGDAEVVNKCCPQGQSLSEAAECVDSSHQWLYMNFSYGFPNCESLVVNVNVSDIVSCIDNSPTTGSIVGLKCKADPFRFSAPEVHYVRKCCPIDRIYDAVQQSCYSERYADSRPPKEFFNVLMSGAKGVIDIRVGAPKCPKGFVLTDNLVHFNEVRREDSESIVFHQHDDKPKIFNPDEVCTDWTERHEMLVVRACQPAEIVCHPNGKLTCLLKCCEDGKAFISNYSGECVPSYRPLKPLKFYNITPSGPIEHEPANPAYFYNIQCTEKYVLNPLEEPMDVHYIGVDGLLYMTTHPVGVSDFCVEDVYHEDESLNGVFTFKCFNDYDADTKTQIVVYGYSMIVSVVFLLLTLVVYSCLPSLRNLHGKTLMCYLTCLLLAYTVQSITILSSPSGDGAIAGLLCKILGFTDHFAFTSAFFWLNVISFDIWWNFGTIRPKSGRQANDKKRLAAYNVFAWGMGTISTAAALLSQETDWLPEYARADMGITACWYEKNTYGVYLFFIGPTSISQACNIVFFVFTAHHCAKVRNELRRIAHTNAEESRFKADRKKFIMNLKLFVVMGLSWVLENVSYWDPENETNIFFLSDVANALQGLFIFGIFILKKRVLKAFARKVKEVLGLAEPRHHRPSTSSTVFTVMSSSTKLATVGKVPPPLRKSCSDSGLSIGGLNGKRHQKGHTRTYSTTSNNTLSVVHDYRFKPG